MQSSINDRRTRYIEGGSDITPFDMPYTLYDVITSVKRGEITSVEEISSLIKSKILQDIPFTDDRFKPHSFNIVDGKYATAVHKYFELLRAIAIEANASNTIPEYATQRLRVVMENYNNNITSLGILLKNIININQNTWQSLVTQNLTTSSRDRA